MRNSDDVLKYIEDVFRSASERPTFYALSATGLEEVLLNLDALRGFILSIPEGQEDRSYSRFLEQRGYRSTLFTYSKKKDTEMDPDGSERQRFEEFRRFWTEFLQWRAER